MAGQSACLHAVSHDATPFQFTDVCRLSANCWFLTIPQADKTPVEYFGEQLVKAGYNYYGTERMYSGVTGEEFEVCWCCSIHTYARIVIHSPY